MPDGPAADDGPHDSSILVHKAEVRSESFFYRAPVGKAEKPGLVRG